jgi:hypothetical protein
MNPLMSNHCSEQSDCGMHARIRGLRYDIFLSLVFFSELHTIIRSKPVRCLFLGDTRMFKGMNGQRAISFEGFYSSKSKASSNLFYIRRKRLPGKERKYRKSKTSMVYNLASQLKFHALPTSTVRIFKELPRVKRTQNKITTFSTPHNGKTT